MNVVEVRACPLDRGQRSIELGELGRGKRVGELPGLQSRTDGQLTDHARELLGATQRARLDARLQDGRDHEGERDQRKQAERIELAQQ